MECEGVAFKGRGNDKVRRSCECEVFFVTETKSRRCDRLRIPRFDIYSCNNYNQGEGGAGGGVAIFIRQKIKRQVLTFDNIKGNFDIIGVRIEGEKRNINFICVYRRPGNVERKGT